MGGAVMGGCPPTQSIPRDKKKKQGEPKDNIIIGLENVATALKAKFVQRLRGQEDTTLLLW